MDSSLRASRRTVVGRWLPVVVSFLAACGPRAEAVPVARVEAWTLSVDRLADLLVLAQPLPLDSSTVGAVVEQWIAMAALARRAADGTDLDGAEALDASLWLERREATLAADRRLRSGSVDVSAERARAEFTADTLLLLAHVLRRTDASASKPERDLQRRAARRVLDGLLAGGSWADAVRESEDEETRAASGLLGLLRLAELPSPLQGAAARLEPGQVSSIVESGQGYHILHRPRFDEVADLYASLLSARLLAAADVQTAARLLDSLEVRPAPGAVPAVRTLARASEPAVLDAPLATWKGGALGPDVAAKYVAALPDDGRSRLAAAPDDAVRTFIEQLAIREAQLQIARDRGIQPDSATLAGLVDMHRADVDGWRSALARGAAPLSQAALDRHMERLVSRQVAQQPLPPLFRHWLLEPLDWDRNRTAEAAAVAAARRLLDAANDRSAR